MVKFLIVGDLHWRAESPIGRTDNYRAALARKLEECWDLARRHRVDGIVQTGDMFDSPDVALSTMDELWDILEAAPAPIYTVPGNHDLYGSNPETFYRTPLGHLSRRGVIHNLDLCPAGELFALTDGQERINDPGAGYVILSGRGYSFTTDVDKSQYAIPAPVLQRSDDKICIHVTHGMLLDSPPPSVHMRWTLLEEASALPNAPDVIINGHYHFGTGVRYVCDTLFINPGALCRLKADLREIYRPVQVALLEIEAGKLPSAQLITLESARPGDEVLSRDHLIAEVERQARRDEFVASLNSKMDEALDVTAMVDEIARIEAVQDEVRQGALRRISEAMEILAQGSRA